MSAIGGKADIDRPLLPTTAVKKKKPRTGGGVFPCSLVPLVFATVASTPFFHSAVIVGSESLASAPTMKRCAICFTPVAAIAATGGSRACGR